MVQAGTYFPKVRRMLFYNSPFILGYFWPASTQLHKHIAFAIPSLPETDPQILELWGYVDVDHLGKSFQAMDLGLECLHDVPRLMWIQHIGWVSASLSSSAKSMKTSAAPCLGYATQLSCNFQHGHCTFVTVLLRPFAGLFINLAVCIRALFSKSASIHGHVAQAFWRMPFFT